MLFNEKNLDFFIRARVRCIIDCNGVFYNAS